ncbi:serine/threonine-protein kinase BLUS1 isoform X2 [Daucus carota subsp. sativus]|uniref:serine/threonine-protein kinase BLUS1 isoform X2 n=1 Tax=Daucus carota subsp. sativus TaxID=79200 RepID=UPI0007EFE07E|nr:PREDICTED: serine/threonine-protein kinase BLUS1-like isoform X2 [Daucus carota subsp. sativus]
MGGDKRSYSATPNDYKLLEEIGYGASATVYRAIYVPTNETIAVKCLDLDRCNSNLDDIRREAQTMSLINHPNVITAHCSFVVDRNLWVVMPFMDEGSCLHLMKIAYPDGFEESAIASFLKETLKALVYLHHHGHIHRDVKAGNILLDSHGKVKLADFGVSACMFDQGDRQRSRNTFVGTPCWMAPEVLQPGSGYDFKADIWSFGITALELAHGHAPFSKYPPMKVLLMTIQNAPPGLDYDRDKRFSKSFKEMVAMCLVKDQTKRPTAEKLLKHSFFKHAKPPEISIRKLFADLPPLWNRVKSLQQKDAAQLALKKMPSAEQEAISQSEYQRGVSAWNFDIEDLKVQASLVQDDDETLENRLGDENMNSYMHRKDAGPSSSLQKSISIGDFICREQESGNEVPMTASLNKTGKNLESEALMPANARMTDIIKDSSKPDLQPSASEINAAQAKTKALSGTNRQTHSGPLVAGAISERMRILERSETENQLPAEKAYREVRRAPSFSGPLMLPNRASANSLSAPIKPSAGYRDDDKSKTNFVQIRGRFSVTSENVDLVKPVGQSPKETSNKNLPASLLMPHLQNLSQQTSIQQDLIMNLLNSLQMAEAVDGSPNGKLPPLPRTSENNGSIESAASERERLLLFKISELQTRMVSLTNELTAEKLKYIQLQQQLYATNGREEDRQRDM